MSFKCMKKIPFDPRFAFLPRSLPSVTFPPWASSTNQNLALEASTRSRKSGLNRHGKSLRSFVHPPCWQPSAICMQVVFEAL